MQDGARRGAVWTGVPGLPAVRGGGSMKSRDELSIRRQVRFGEEGLEADQAVDTDLKDWGLDIDEDRGESRVLEPEASEFGVDDRHLSVDTESEQEPLFHGGDRDQRTLDGNDLNFVANF